VSSNDATSSLPVLLLSATFLLSVGHVFTLFTLNRISRRNRNIVFGIRSGKLVLFVFTVQILYSLSSLLSDTYFLLMEGDSLEELLFSGLYFMLTILFFLIWWTVSLDMIGPPEEKEKQDYL